MKGEPMQNKDGVFIAIEGIDGAGKATQFELLTKRLDLAGFEVARFDFPRYDDPSSYFVKQYLNGAYGSLNDVGPYTASLFYALDRYAASKQIRDALAKGKIVLSNRFTGSNMAHQGTKFTNADERRGFFIWLDNLEFEMLKIPRPDLNLVLRVPAELAQMQVDKKEKRSYTDKKRDIHEEDLDHLRLTSEVYDDMCQLFPRDYVRVDSVRSGEMMPPETISNLVWEKVFPLLPKPTRSRKSAKATANNANAVVSTANPYIEKTEEGIGVTEMGESFLADITTDPSGPVYSFTDAISPVNVAAAFARFAQKEGDFRLGLLDEIIRAGGNDNALLSQSKQSGAGQISQLVGMHVIFEGASSLLIKKIEWGRLASYLEQPARCMSFDQKNTDGNYKYVTPEYFDDTTKHTYRKQMDTLFDLYSEMVAAMTEHLRTKTTADSGESKKEFEIRTRERAVDALRPVLPVAANSTVGLFASAQSIENLINCLTSDELPEARQAGQRLQAQARKTIPALFDTPNSKKSDTAASSYRTTTAAELAKRTSQFLPANHADDVTVPVDLVDICPRNELHLVADMLYEHSTMSLRDLQHISNSWPYDKKVTVLNTYIGDRKSRHDLPGRSLEKAHYSWDIVSDFDTFRILQRHRIVDDLNWQKLTPRFGYEVPELIEEAGLTEKFEKCFDISLALYSKLQQSGFNVEAQYATLYGHKLRWKITYNAREAFHILELYSGEDAEPKVQKLVRQMHEKIAESHPLIAGAMKFAK
ncbi:MAG TPA: FAD-dependent thymidylate synthase [Candidatus Saccharimonadales bacterium]|nr:FAD-dependent thymidylate synthase [Candidatus Saccharimonadales bacterium]